MNSLSSQNDPPTLQVPSPLCNLPVDKCLALRWSVILWALLSGSIGLPAAAPTVGEHALSRFPNSIGYTGSLSTVEMNTQARDSTMLVWVGRGDLSRFTPATVPTDNKGNTYTMLGSVQSYAPKYPGSGEALFAASVAAGGGGHVVTTRMPIFEEITLAVVEVKDGGVIEEVQSSVVLGPPHTSPSVTTSGPATLVAIWAGDGSVANSAFPNNDFTKIEEIFLPAGTPYIQAAIATKDVQDAGDYNVTWTADPLQGAHLWLVAVQSVSPPPLLAARSHGGHLIISWPAEAGGYGLEKTDVLSASGSIWTSVTNVPVIIGGQNTVTNEMTSETMFYRLKK